MVSAGSMAPDSVLEGRVEISTPDRVVFFHPLGGISLRGVACLIDVVIQFTAVVFVLLVGAILTAFVEAGTDLMAWAGEMVPLAWLWAAVLFLVWLVYTGYFVIFETIWNGQTPGKRILRIRVIKDNGGPIGFYEALLRNVLRVVDSFPSFYAVGILSALCSGREQRLGDLVAGTMVVHESREVLADTGAWRREVTEEAKAFERLLGLDRLGEADLVLVRDFLERRRQLAPDHRGEIAVAIATALARKMRFSSSKPIPAEVFLEAAGYQLLADEDVSKEEVGVAPKPVPE